MRLHKYFCCRLVVYLFVLRSEQSQYTHEGQLWSVFDEGILWKALRETTSEIADFSLDVIHEGNTTGLTYSRTRRPRPGRHSESHNVLTNNCLPPSPRLNS